MGNRSFYFPGHSVRYAVDIKDKEDGAGLPDRNHLIVTADYLEGSDRAAAPRGASNHVGSDGRKESDGIA